MGPSEIVDSGRNPAAHQKSNFAQTCSLLSQYLKENGSFGNLGLGLTRNFEPIGPPAKTMNLLPMIENTGKNSEAPGDATKSEPEKAQMTIFYNGQVIVFNDFPAEKAKEIMNLASKASSPSIFSTADINMPLKPTESVNSLVQDNVQKHLQTNVNDLPIARKASLTRFLEKRKDRITARAPYPVGVGAAAKPAEGKPWLGLAPQVPQRMERLHL